MDKNDLKWAFGAIIGATALLFLICGMFAFGWMPLYHAINLARILAWGFGTMTFVLLLIAGISWASTKDNTSTSDRNMYWNPGDGDGPETGSG